ncbi:Serine/threonine-protein kinase PLK4 [Nosema granulosis]|uniref:non-specific serine/threonine protein kinase n=1 Tax=Nosema granulosis TaxID=83296 RepID=A0A9P6GWX3_9MICR|nr:Serine/threonine-protein kinase PLK4 [Nosema granulosis]
MPIPIFKSLKIITLIGKGRHSNVYKVLNKENDKCFALKRISKNIAMHRELDFYQREKRAFDVLTPHPNVVTFKAYDEEENEAFFILEYIDGFTLQRIINESRKDEEQKKISNSQIKKYLIQILDGIEHLHKHNVYHSDIKPENIVICGERAVIVDLGSSIISDKKTVKYRDVSFLGTPGFLPPEVADMVSRSDVELPFVDLWAFGVTMYFAYTNHVPFVSNLAAESHNNVKKLNVDLSILPYEVREILEYIFTKDKQKRLELKEIRKLIMRMNCN